MSSRLFPITDIDISKHESADEVAAYLNAVLYRNYPDIEYDFTADHVRRYRKLSELWKHVQTIPDIHERRDAELVIDDLMNELGVWIIERFENWGYGKCGDLVRHFGQGVWSEYGSTTRPEDVAFGIEALWLPADAGKYIKGFTWK